MKPAWKWCLWIVVWATALPWAWAEEARSEHSTHVQTTETGSAASSQAAPASEGPRWTAFYLGTAASLSVIIFAAAYGISKIGATAVENMARQPEIAGSINTAMIISAALIEGVTFFALIVCLLNIFYR